MPYPVVCRFAAVLLLALLAGAAPAAPTTPTAMKSYQQFPLAYAPTVGVGVSIDVKQGHLIARLPGNKSQDLGEVEFEERFNAALILQADFNYDGYGDFAIHSGSGYAGAISGYQIYLWDAVQGRFNAYKEIVGNPVLVPSRKALLDGSRDGPRSYTSELRPQNGKLYEAVLRQEAVADGIDYVTFYDPSGEILAARVVESPTDPTQDLAARPPARVRIKVDKTWLHDAPNAAGKTRMYLIKGDAVTLLDYKPKEDEPMGGYGWFLARFVGKKIIEKWIDGQALVE
jgi:hypothetical protein